MKGQRNTLNDSNRFKDKQDKHGSRNSSVIINAAALQDHLARSITLNVIPRTKHKITDEPKKSICSNQVSHARLNCRNRSNQQTEYRKVWICEACTSENVDFQDNNHRHHIKRCNVCGTAKKAPQRSTQLTLAQSRGLVACPPPKLTPTEWDKCEQQAESRGDITYPCSICQEKFGMQKQVILSCSHMFHLACITSFERFLRTNQRVCPLCRKANYEKRSTIKGLTFHRDWCVKRIQAVYRGHLCRKLMDTKWLEYYRKGNGDPNRRRNFLANRMSKTTNQLTKARQVQDDSIDALLAEFDRSISFSRRVFQPESHIETAKTSESKLNWTDIAAKAIARADAECPICLNPFVQEKDIQIASCTHVFHSQCLQAFEKFNIYEISLCPICRAAYSSRSLMALY